MEEYKCFNYDKCGIMIVYSGHGRKPTRCKQCQELYSKELRRNTYKEKNSGNIKITKCNYVINNNHVCDNSISYTTNKPKYCFKHAKKVRLEWLKKYYTNNKIVYCPICNRPIQYETKKPDLCTLCRSRQKLKEKITLLNRKD